MTILEAIHYGEQRLQEAGVIGARWNAERLLMLVLQMDRARVYAHLNQKLSESDVAAFAALVDRRAEHYPLAYLEGSQEFFGRQFLVNEAVLIPRPETEEIVRAVLSLNLPSNPRILDLGGGSGNICATLAAELPGSRNFALEKSAAALPVLRQNAKDVMLVRGDLFEPPFKANAFNVITSNPPYVEKKDYDSLPAETLHEPKLALLTESLEITYRTLLKVAGRLLRDGGYFVFEIGFRQEERIHELYKGSFNWELIEVRRDHQNIPRTFILSKKTGRL